jgi:PAS domain S-box-containing protein
MKASHQADDVSAHPNGADSPVLPESLLAAESALAELASVFFPSDVNVEQLAQGFTAKWKAQPDAEAEWPDVVSRYRILVEQIPAVVFMAFLDQGISEAYVSPQIETMLGFTQAEWLNDPVRWFRQIHPDDKARWSTEAAHTFLTGEPLRSDYRVLARDGRVVWFHCEVRMVRHADGRPWFIHGVGFDVTEQKQAEDALRKSEDMLRGIFEYAPDTIVVIDRHGRIERVNAQVAEMFGYASEELLGRQVEVLLPARFRRRHTKHRTNYLADPHLRPMGAGLELYGRRKSGEEFPVEIMLSPVEAATGSLVIAVIRDITRRKQSEAALRESADRLKVLSRRLIEVQEAERRSLALELHDEVGQILTGLKLTLEMCARLPAEQSREQIAQAQTLVNELMARARKMSLDLRPATLDHLGLLSALLWHIRQYGAQTHVRVEFKHGGLEGRRFPAEVETAAFRIVQEALTNVARHADAAEASVLVWADAQSLTIQIEDRGRGFDAVAALAGDSTSGLAGMRERASLLGGGFTAESRPGAGTRLTAEFPVGDSQNNAPRESD